MKQSSKPTTGWISASALPEPLKAERYVLEPLDEPHAVLDFAALMSCSSRLREELQWGDWPREDFTVELNRVDLRRHRDEFNCCEAFAYTVLSHDHDRCLGCIYIERCDTTGDAQLAYWVIDDAIDMEATLVTEVLQWLHGEWSFDRVLLPLRQANTRGISIAEMCKSIGRECVLDGSLAGFRCFVSMDSWENERRANPMES